MKYIIKYSLVLGLLFSLSACYDDPSEIPTPAPVVLPSPGTADFSSFIAVGNSVTAGFTNSGYYNDAIAVAFPNLMAQQFSQVGGGSFASPFFAESQKHGGGYLYLASLPASPTDLPEIEFYGPGSPGFMSGIVGSNGGTSLLAKYTGSLNNFGIPGLKVADLETAGYGFSNPAGFNPYYERLLGAGNATSSYIDFLDANKPSVSFFSLWLGNNDLLFWATNGGVDAGPAFLTPVGTFNTNFRALLDNLTEGGADGAVANLPDVTSGTFFRTVTEALILSQVNAQLPNGAPPVEEIFIETSVGPRAAGTNDLFMISQISGDYLNIGRQDFGAGAPFPYGLHPNNPLVSTSILDADEVAMYQARRAEFNSIIDTETQSRNLALVDLNASFADYFENNVSFGGITYTGEFVTGGVISLDGVHFTPAGNALIANEFITAINAEYGATINPVNVTNYPGFQLGF